MKQHEELCEVKDKLLAAKEQESMQQQVLLEASREENELKDKKLAVQTEEMNLQTSQMKVLKVCLYFD